MSIVLPRIFRDPPESQQNEAEANGEEDDSVLAPVLLTYSRFQAHKEFIYLISCLSFHYPSSL